MAHAAMKEELVSQELLMETGEVDFLEQAEMVKDAVTWRAREIRLNTRQVYSQEKYNLLREESEGYAKLVTAVNGQGKGSLRPEMVPALVGAILITFYYFEIGISMMQTV
jgi:THO complex subunit 2